MLVAAGVSLFDLNAPPGVIGVTAAAHARFQPEVPAGAAGAFQLPRDFGLQLAGAGALGQSGLGSGHDFPAGLVDRADAALGLPACQAHGRGEVRVRVVRVVVQVTPGQRVLARNEDRLAIPDVLLLGFLDAGELPEVRDVLFCDRHELLNAGQLAGLLEVVQVSPGGQDDLAPPEQAQAPVQAFVAVDQDSVLVLRLATALFNRLVAVLVLPGQDAGRARHVVREPHHLFGQGARDHDAQVVAGLTVDHQDAHAPRPGHLDDLPRGVLAAGLDHGHVFQPFIPVGVQALDDHVLLRRPLVYAHGAVPAVTPERRSGPPPVACFVAAGLHDRP